MGCLRVLVVRLKVLVPVLVERSDNEEKRTATSGGSENHWHLANSFFLPGLFGAKLYNRLKAWEQDAWLSLSTVTLI